MIVLSAPRRLLPIAYRHRFVLVHFAIAIQTQTIKVGRMHFVSVRLHEMLHDDDQWVRVECVVARATPVRRQRPLLRLAETQMNGVRRVDRVAHRRRSHGNAAGAATFSGGSMVVTQDYRLWSGCVDSPIHFGEIRLGGAFFQICRLVDARWSCTFLVEKCKKINQLLSLKSYTSILRIKQVKSFIKLPLTKSIVNSISDFLLLQNFILKLKY